MDARVTEFHNIMPLENLASVLMNGIVSHEGAAALPHRSVAMQQVQNLRDAKQVPQGLRLHQYANLYFHARNPMMYVRRGEAGSLCVLRVSINVLQLAGVVLADRNASSGYARFLAPHQIDLLPYDWVYALDWTDPDEITGWRKKAARCAEVLVPHRVDPAYIQGAYVRDQVVAEQIRRIAPQLPLTINAHLFFG